MIDFRLKWPATILMAGGSGSGKSSLVSEMIKKLPVVFNRMPEKIIVCYSHDQTLYQDFKRNAPCPIEFIEGLPNDLITPKNTLLIIDDLQGKQATAAIRDWFIKKSHHYDTSVIYIVQNIFDKSADHRTISLNSHYLIIMKNPRDKSQIVHLAKQTHAGDIQVMLDAYKLATAVSHSYLLVDLTQTTPDLFRLRDSVFAEPGTHVFIDKKTNAELVNLHQHGVLCKKT